MWDAGINKLLEPKFPHLSEKEVMDAIADGGAIAAEVTRLTMHYVVLYRRFAAKNNHMPPEAMFASFQRPIQKIAIRKAALQLRGAHRTPAGMDLTD